MLHIGNQKIGEIYLGGTKIKEAYLGSQLVYQKKDWVEVGGVKWAKFNVGAPKTFVESIYDYGMLYKFNNKVGWPATGTISASNPASNGATAWDSASYGSTSGWLAENDPSPAGWRLPTGGTDGEFQKLASAFSVWDATNKGRWFADVQSDLGDPEKSIFLRFGGWRQWTTPLYLGQYGFFWTSTPNNSTFGGLIEIAINRVSYSNGYYETACNLRCVKL
jgi:hypothetical protein